MALPKFLRQFLPLPLLQVFEQYEKASDQKINKKAIDDLQVAAGSTHQDNIKNLLAHALRYLDDERSRASSILSRGQALLVAQSFFGALLAFSTGLLGKSNLFSGWLLAALIIFVIYGLLMMVLLTANSLRATELLPYKRIGTSDLALSIGKSTHEFEKFLALDNLSNYRHSATVNTWRATHLTYAQMCLRNVVFTLTAIIAVVFIAAINDQKIELWPRSQAKPIPFTSLQFGDRAIQLCEACPLEI